MASTEMVRNNQEDAGIPATKRIITNRSIFPKDLTSRLQQAWISAVSNGHNSSPPKATVQPAASSTNTGPPPSLFNHRGAPASARSTELTATLENLFMTTKLGKRKAEGDASNPSRAIDDGSRSSSSNVPGPLASAAEAPVVPMENEDALRLQLQDGLLDYSADETMWGEAVEEEFYRGIHGLQDAFQDMETHLPHSLSIPDGEFADLADDTDSADFLEDFLSGHDFEEDIGSTREEVDVSYASTAAMAEQREAAETLERIKKECKKHGAEDSRGGKEGHRAVQLLIDVAKAIVARDEEASRKLLAELSQVASVYGTATQRVSAYFLHGLSAKLAKELPEIDQREWKLSGYLSPDSNSSSCQSSSCLDESGDIEKLIGGRTVPMVRPLMESFEVVMNASPYLTFGQVAANSTILECCSSYTEVHIVDFGIGLGLQWPALIQAMAVRPGGPPKVRITGIEPKQEVEQGEGVQVAASHCQLGIRSRLSTIAKAWGVQLEFSILNLSVSDVTAATVGIKDGECVIANCPLRLHRLLSSCVEQKSSALTAIRALNPKLCTIVEQKSNRGSPFFLTRFYEALYYYLTLFDSLEKSVPGNKDGERLFERYVFGRAIVNVVAGRGQENCEGVGGQRDGDWRQRMHEFGFRIKGASASTLTTVRGLLQTYRSGYGLLQENECLTLTWDDKPLLTMTSWVPV